MSKKKAPKIKISQIDRELEQVRKMHGGKLRAKDVVEFARNPKTRLHQCFTWDDTEAAKRWRLHQARQLIRVRIMRHEAVKEPIRAYVSLYSDRRKRGGGYWPTPRVLSKTTWREELLAQLLMEIRALEKKYSVLVEAAPIFAAAEQVRAAHPKAARLAAEQAVRGTDLQAPRASAP